MASLWGIVLALGLPPGLGAQASGDGTGFVLSDPESEVYYRFAAAAGEEIKVSEQVEVTGDLHSNGEVDLKETSLVTGDVSAVGDVKAVGTVVGAVTPFADPVELPELLDVDTFRDLADRVFDHDVVFEDEVIDDVVFVDGRVRIRGTIGGVGTLVATRDVQVQGIDDEGDGGGGSEPPVLDEGARLSLISLEGIDVKKGRALRGILFAGDGIKISEDVVFEGVLVAGGSIDVKAGARVTFLDFDQVPPEIVLLSPEDGSFVATAAPEISVAYSDDFSGLRLDSLELLLDGVDRIDEATVTESGLTFTPGPLAEGPHALEVAITDPSDNETRESFTFTVDVTPPVITATLEPPANAAGWNNTDVTVTFDCQDALSGVASCPGPVTLSDEGAGQMVEGTAVDRVGNRATASVTASIDRTPPTFDPAELRPLPCPELTLELRPQVRACSADALSGVVAETVRLLVDGVDRTAAAVIADGCIAWDPPDDLLPGEHQASIAATDRAGNAASSSWCFDVASPALDVAIDSPETGFVTREASVEVSGTVDELAETVEVNGVAATLGGGSFHALDVPLREGKTVVTAVARNAAGGIGTASVPVFRDTTPPVVRIETPRDGAVLTSLQVDVAGLVNDVIVGTTINADDCDVTINGVPAQVANRSFVVPDLLLTRGVNTLVAEARDRTGNVATHSIQVTVEDRAGQRIRLLAGNGQTAGIFEELPDPLVVVLEDADGDPVPRRPVTFSVIRGDGTVRAFPEEATSVTVESDDFGRASVRFELGGRTGAGNNRVLATAPGFLGEVEFCAAAMPDPAARITTLSGDSQRGVVERPLPLPLGVLVTDQGGNPVGSVDVTFEVVEGGGSFDGSSTAVITTDLDGLADVVWTLGPDEGLNNNAARASFPGLVESSTTFTASAMRVGRPSDTRLSGLVVDNQDRPVPGVRVSVEGTSLVTTTDDEGQFSLAGVPVGSIRMRVDGTTTPRPGRWVELEYDLTTISGRDNSFDRPIYLLPVSSGEVAGGPEDVTLKMDNVPGAELTVFADSVTCPDGSSTCTVSVTQVRGERVPRPPPLGSSFMLAWTIQPPGVHFDPPARLCIPNANEPPGKQVEMFSFDHDQGEFVAIGTATVTTDGSQICSDPGFGVLEGGWHGCVPPPPPKDCVADCGPCKKCNPDSGSCEPVADGASCDDDNDCTQNDRCSAGSCSGEPVADGTPCEDDGDACSEDVCKAASCTHPTPGVEVMLDAPDGFDIDDTPAMPDITAMAQVTGIDPDPTASTTFRWETMIEFQSCGVRDIDEELDPVETGSEYVPVFPNIRGGELTIKATILKDGEECAMDEATEMIQGTNPQVGDVDTALGGALEMRMACQESQKRQFNGSPGDPLTRCEPDGRIGVGILQVTDPEPSDDAFWDWTQNITEGLAILAQKQASAAGYAGRVRRSLNDPTIPNLTAQQLVCETVQRFNGGAYWRWNPQARQWEANPPNTYVDLVFRWSTTGQCTVVPVSQRPTCQ